MVTQPTTNTQAMGSSSDRPLRLHARRDLSHQRQQYQGRDYWVVKDPIALKYYRFEEEEYALLMKLDGKTTPSQIKRWFDYQYAPQKISLQELFQFIGMLYRSSLLVSESPDQGVALCKRGDENRRREKWQSLTNVLAIRYKGFDPDNLLGYLNRWVGWFFSWPLFFCVLILGMCAGGLMLTQFETFQSKLPTFQDFFAASNWIWLAAVLAITKILHEFGHGLACKKFGGQCHEMGVMLLVLTPCLYVNVSDSWLLPSKWKRAFIAAAGMYVELVLASIAVFVWWFSQPGIVNQLALNVIFVCSVSTLLFNANPLLRYDGYYILSDLLEIPNLRTKATTILQRTCGHWLLGIEARPDPFLPVQRQWLFVLYSVSAALYRWFITFSIFWFVYRILEPYGLKIIGQLIALTALYGLLGMPLIQLTKFFSVPGRMSTVKPIHVTVSAIVLGSMLAGALLIPIPHYVNCHCYVQPAQAANIYVDVPGTLLQVCTQPNQHVAEGQPLFILGSRKLKSQLASMQTRLDLAVTHRENVMQVVGYDNLAAEQLDEAEAAIHTAVTNLSRRQQDLNRLVIRAPIDGFWVAPSRTDKHATDTELGQWDGSPLDEQNLGAFLDQQTYAGQIISDLTKMEAVLAIDQSDIEFIAADQSVEILIRQIPNKIFSSTTATLSPSKLKHVPKSLSSRHGGEIVTVLDHDNREVPQSTKYLIKVPLDNSDRYLVQGGTGIAKIRTGSQTIAQRCWRLISHTFQFEL